MENDLFGLEDSREEGENEGSEYIESDISGVEDMEAESGAAPK